MNRERMKANHLLFCCSLIFIFMAWVLWLFPGTNPLVRCFDSKAFFILNGTVAEKGMWSYFWMLMNHPNEKWLNIVFMLLIQAVIIIFRKKDWKLLLTYFLCYWILMQIFLVSQHYIYNAWLDIDRESPSMKLTPFYNLAAAYNNPQIKTSSFSSFPGGHAFAISLFYIFMSYLLNPKTKVILLILIMPILLGRVISGAHWLTDVIYSILCAFCYFQMVFLFIPQNLKQRLANKEI